MVNHFHSLLASKTKPSLLSNLNLTKNEEDVLVLAAKDIRKAIISGFKDIREKFKREKIEIEVPRPKFAIQGSFAYGTLNDPANPPEQQVDIDLGMYLPFSALGNGQEPKTATTFYFNSVTSILNAFIQSNNNGWQILSGEKEKDTCVRVIVNNKSHIDIPLFAVPESEFNNVIEDRQLTEAKLEVALLTIDEELDMESYQVKAVDPNVIHMAHRKDGWLPSDALVVSRWITHQFNLKGPMIRPVNRFLKAWRDIEWPDGDGPSSIFLLLHSIKSYPDNSNGMNHCQVFKEVVDRLPQVFDSPLLIPCPTSSDKNNKNDLRTSISDENKHIYKQKFESFTRQYNLAKNTNPPEANNILIDLFGERFPRDPSRIVVNDEPDNKVREITGTEPEIHPLRTTERSTSG
ncbi:MULTISPECIES: CBASS cGAMP synthase [Marinomonas]|uniref:Cyclic GMP-AMP synthase n=1 Tax=Marinomonas rhodophyticola TaxID=2992803 RepID=A0ABT3KFT7_9GAMM|nr:CBASS cGAMP synthase [Marinomonas sp. KJ51-3]MCW4629410.1 CBASS cGAMP synthase [Marinomonas sp. KJ51-3]